MIYWRDGVESALGGVGRHKLRALLTMLGMIFGVGAVIAMQAIGEGARRESLAIVESMGLRNVIVKSRDLDEEERRQVRVDSSGLTLDDLAVLEKAVPGAKGAAAKRQLKARAVSAWRQRADEARVFGVSPAYAPLTGLEVARGSFFDHDDDRRAATVAVLGPAAARALFGFDDPLGQAFKIDRVWLTVVGVLAPRTFSEKEFEGVKLESPDNHIYVPVRTALGRFPREPSEDPLDEIVLTLAEGAPVGEAALVAGELLDRLHRHVDDWELVVPYQLMEQSQKTQRIFNIVMGCIAGISLLVGGIGIMNIMLASVLERTREIGVRRAVGARQADVRAQFLLEALLLAVVGGVLGIVFGFTLARGIAAAADWSTAVSLWSVLLAFGVSAGVGLVSGAYPAFRAAALDPVEALHWE